MQASLLSHSSSAPLGCKQDPHCYPSRQQLQHQLQLFFFFSLASSRLVHSLFLFFFIFQRVVRKLASSSHFSFKCPAPTFLFFPSHKSTKNVATCGNLAYFLCCEILVYSLMRHQSVLIFTAHSHGAPAHIARMLAKLVSRFFVFACLCAVCHTAAHRQ